MFRIESGTSHGLADTVAFIELLNALPESLPSERGAFFDSPGELFLARAPGRLDLMGGIADYSGSLVLEFPIASATHVAIQLQEQNALRIISLPVVGEEQPRHFEMALDDFMDSGGPIDYSAAAAYFNRQPQHHWAAYVAGVFLVLMRERGCEFDKGARIIIGSNVPEGKGVSSSAALEVATMRAIMAAYRIEMSAREMAFLCQKVENMVARAPCGVMDQMTSACGEQDRLLALLCQPAELKETIRLPEELAIWGVDSGIRHSVSGADYGTVRTAAFMGYRMIAEIAGLSCRETGTAGHVMIEDPKWKGYLANIAPEEFLDQYAKNLPTLMSGAEFLEKHKGITDPVTNVKHTILYPVRQATRYPVYEHDRVVKFASVLKDWQGHGQAEELGELMYESHQSYSDCGLGSEGTDELVRLAREAGASKGIYGAKITGGGSGGTVAILGGREALAAVRAIAKEYARQTGYAPLIIQGSSPGAAVFGHLKLVSNA
jgi:galactokinase